MREIAVELAPDCEPLARKLGISNDEISLTVNDDENFVAVTTNDFSRMISFREFPGDRIIMVECLVTDIDPGTYDPQDGFVKNIILKKVTVKLAIELRRELPSGTLSKDEKDGESYLAVVAELTP